ADDQTSIYLVFERLNTGGTTLHPQEIRVALFRGPLIRLLRDLNEDDAWRQLYGKRSNRLKDQELILRFFALRFWRDNYQRPMKDFLNRYTAANGGLQLHDEHYIKNSFTTTTKTILENIGAKALPDKTALTTAIHLTI